VCKLQTPYSNRFLKGVNILNYFYWNKNFETGIRKIDEQHKKIVILINQFSLAFSSQNKLPEIESTIDSLQTYIRTHFKDEEAELETSNLDPAEKLSHLKQHRMFDKTLHNLIKTNDIQDYDFATNLHQFLTTWLVSHILGTDMKLARTFKPDTAQARSSDLPLNVSNVESILLNALNESEHRFRFYSDHSPTIVWMADSSGTRTFFNKAYHDFAGEHDPEDESEWLDRIHPEDRNTYLELLDNIDNNKHSHIAEYRLLRHDNQYRYLYEHIISRTETDGTSIGYIASAMDITELKIAQKMLAESNEILENEVERCTLEIRKLITIDELTQIGNRRFIMERLTDETERSNRYNRTLTLLFIDADNFKQINDSFGHSIGDDVLVALSQCIKKEIRHNDFLGRYGGEEFLVLFPEVELKDAEEKAEKIRQKVSELHIDNYPGKLTVSIGVAEYRQKESIKDFIKRGDLGLYEAKKTGRNQVVSVP